MMATTPPRTRWYVAGVFAVLTGTFVAARVLHEPHWPTDFDQLWHAAQALLDGSDPYSVVGPGRAFEWLWPLYYPLPAVLWSVSFTVLSIEAARIAFSTVAAAALGWALAPRWRTHWPLLLSAAYIIAASRNQWAPFFLAASWVPYFAILVPAKPNVGLSSVAALRGRSLVIAVGGCLAVALLSFLVRPDWLTSWRNAIETAPHIQSAITTMPFGPLLGLAALRWKRMDARLFLAFVALPHTPSLYDLLILFFVARTFRETVTLAVLTQALYWGIVMFGSFQTFDAYADGVGRAAILVVYLPVMLALLTRPNQAADPAEPAETTPLLPHNWIDAGLLGLLMIAATMLVWLPLVTYR